MIRIIVFLFLVIGVSCVSNKNVTIQLTVASEQSDCYGLASRKCLLVKKEGQTEWQNFYSNIEGFTYESGYEYVLKVKEEPIENPPADGSSIKYKLVKLVSKIEK